MQSKVVKVIDFNNNELENMTRFQARHLVKRFQARYLEEDSICLLENYKKREFNLTSKMVMFGLVIVRGFSIIKNFFVSITKII